MTTKEKVEEKPKSIYDQFATDKNAESKEGIVLDYGAAGKIRIHRAGGANQKFKNYTSAQLKPYTRQMQQDTMDEEVAKAISAKIYAKTVIIGWEGVRGRDGDLLEFTEENVIRVLLDLPELFADIQRAAQDASLFRASVADDVEGN